MSMLFELLPDEKDGNARFLQFTPPLIETVDDLVMALAEMPPHTYYVTSVHPGGRSFSQVIAVHWCDHVTPNAYRVVVTDPADWNTWLDDEDSPTYMTTSSVALVLMLGSVGVTGDTAWVCMRTSTGP